VGVKSSFIDGKINKITISEVGIEPLIEFMVRAVLSKAMLN